MNGILLVNKESGFTSQDTLNVIKRTLKINKIGHAGTLDPLATGLLVVLINDATKLSNYILEKEKEYVAEITLGFSTDTEDITGNIVEKMIVENIEPLKIDSTLNKMIGKTTQIPPMYSAIKQNGKKLYELARLGKTVVRESKEIEIFDLRRTSELIYENDILRFSFYARVSKGTYIRTVCTEIGKMLGYPANMSKLNRLKSGCFDIRNSYTLTDIKNGKYEILNMLDALVDFEIKEVNDSIASRVLSGMSLNNEIIKCKNDIIVIKNNNNLIGIYKKDDNNYKALRVWN